MTDMVRSFDLEIGGYLQIAEISYFLVDYFITSDIFYESQSNGSWLGRIPS